ACSSSCSHQFASSSRRVGFDPSHVPSGSCQLGYSLAYIAYFSPDNVVRFADIAHESLEPWTGVRSVQHPSERRLQLVPVDHYNVNNGHFLLHLLNNTDDCGPFLWHDRGSF